MDRSQDCVTISDPVLLSQNVWAATLSTCLESWVSLWLELAPSAGAESGASMTSLLVSPRIYPTVFGAAWTLGPAPEGVLRLAEME